MSGIDKAKDKGQELMRLRLGPPRWVVGLAG
jgi:hypothetical protein